MHSYIDKFGKKMMPPEKNNIKFGENGVDVKSPQKEKPRNNSNDSSEKKSGFNKFSTNINIKDHSHEAKSGLYQQKYNKNQMDNSKLKSSVPEGHLFDDFRNRNLYNINLPIKDHNYEMPTSGAQE